MSVFVCVYECKDNSMFVICVYYTCFLIYTHTGACIADFLHLNTGRESTIDSCKCVSLFCLLMLRRELIWRTLTSLCDDHCQSVHAHTCRHQKYRKH